MNTYSRYYSRIRNGEQGREFCGGAEEYKERKHERQYSFPNVTRCWKKNQTEEPKVNSVLSVNQKVLARFF